MKKPLSVKDAAERAGVGEAVVRAWVSSRVLPHYHLGRKEGRGKIGIDEGDLLAFLETRRVRAAEPAPAQPAGGPKQHKGRGGDDFTAFYADVMAQVAKKRQRR
jgi:excisionase family DNA binding protein